MKKGISGYIRHTYVLILAMVLLMVPSYAYLDAATTSYIIQIFAGMFIAAAAAVGIFWKRIVNFFRKLKIKNLEKKLSKQADKKEENI